MVTKHKYWGTEFWIHNDKDYCGKILTIKKGFEIK